jgi:hypothetical protein
MPTNRVMMLVARVVLVRAVLSDLARRPKTGKVAMSTLVRVAVNVATVAMREARYAHDEDGNTA